MERLFLHLVHVIIFGSLFLYIGLTRTAMPNYMFTVSLVLGIIIILYHSFKLFLKVTKKEFGGWINLIHIFIVGPLLLYIGYTNKDTSRKYFELLLMLAFAVIGYHGYYLVTDLMPSKASSA